jgi:uncharacterized membrane protein
MANATREIEEVEPGAEPVGGRAAPSPGRAIPDGWTYNPSAWPKRLLVIALAVLNCGIAGCLALYELGIIHSVWDPIFGAGTARVLDSTVSRAFPVPDAALGACAYLAEAVLAAIGGSRRWRDRPWPVLAFVLLTVPLGITSIALVIMQPVVIHAWCTLCLAAAAIMLLIASLSVDEVVAAVQGIVQAARGGEPILGALFRGSARREDEAAAPGPRAADDTGRAARPIEGFSVPWSLAACLAIGIWLLVSPAVLGTRGVASAADCVSGALVSAFALLACAEVARPVRFLCTLCGLWVMILAPWSLTYTAPLTRPDELVCGAAIVLLSLIRPRAGERFDGWDRYMI